MSLIVSYFCNQFSGRFEMKKLSLSICWSPNWLFSAGQTMLAARYFWPKMFLGRYFWPKKKFSVFLAKNIGCSLFLAARLARLDARCTLQPDSHWLSGGFPKNTTSGLVCWNMQQLATYSGQHGGLMTNMVGWYCRQSVMKLRLPTILRLLIFKDESNRCNRNLHKQPGLLSLCVRFNKASLVGVTMQC